MDEPIKIPVSMLGAFGQPMLVGKATIFSTKHVEIDLDNDWLLEEFYDLRDQELTFSVSFNYCDRTPETIPN